MISSPFIATRRSVAGTMARVLAALVPGIVAYVAVFGPGILVNLALASVSALASEAALLKLRGVALKPFLGDGSALLSAWLLALSITPLGPWWLAVVGAAIAIVFAKQLYGGLGNNLFNPAMVGFAALLVSFPTAMTHWPASAAHADIGAQIAALFGGAPLDALSTATPLDHLKTQVRQHVPVGDVLREPLYGAWAGRGSEWIALMYLAGGLYLWRAKVIGLRIPLAFLAGMALIAGALWLHDPARYTNPLFHLLAGGSMLGAFFIATDPVTAASTPRGQILYGFAIGLLAYLIRVFGGYPDGVAFAVLILNAFAPLIDAHTQPRIFGHAARGKGAP